MGCKELIDSLRAAGDGRMRALRTDAEQEMERIRSEAEARVQALRQQHAAQQSAAAAEQASRIISEANAAARLVRLRSERAFAERLSTLARSSLPSLRNIGYGDVFASFVQELPPFVWKTVRVNPGDADLARKHFPGAEIVPDPGITGGLIAISEGDQVRIVNTFERRLESLWEELLPDIMKEAEELIR
jgi:vacuolar-type H+-ATPase subunit E/Vma4